MFSNVSEKITDSLVKSGTVDSDERDIYLFGVQQGLFVILNVATTVAIGFMLDVFWQLLIFTGALIALKSYAGGYHAKTSQRCYLFSTLLTISVTSAIKYVILHAFAYVGLIMLAGIIIIMFSPISCENRALDDLERKVYRKKAIIICAIEIVAAVVFLCLNLQSVAIGIIWCLVAVSLMMIGCLLGGNY